MSYLRDFFGSVTSSGRNGNPDAIAGFLRRLSLECSSDTQVTIKSGSKIGLDDGSDVITVSSDITVAITSSGVNGLDTGSEASNTWYYIWLIYNGTTAAGLLSTSNSSPTLPSGYTKKRLIGAVRNDGSTNFHKFLQYGADIKYQYDNGFQIVSSGSASSYTSVNISNYIPTNLSNKINLAVQYQHSSSVRARVFLSDDGSNAQVTLQTEVIGGNGIVEAVPVDMFVSSQLIYFRTDDSGGTGLVYISVSGFTLDL